MHHLPNFIKTGQTVVDI